jgi:hypothetical protein
MHFLIAARIRVNLSRAGHFGGSPRGGPATLDSPFFFGGGGLGCHLAGFPPTQRNLVFCLLLLNYMTSRLHC